MRCVTPSDAQSLPITKVRLYLGKGPLVQCGNKNQPPRPASPIASTNCDRICKEENTNEKFH